MHSSLLVLAFSAIFFESAVTQAAILRLPLARTGKAETSGLTDLERARRRLSSAEAKHAAPSASSNNKRTDSGVDVPITAIVQDAAVDTNFMYLATIEIGTPAQSVQVQIDTGSSDLWVASAECTQCSSNTLASTLYDSAQSSSYTPSTTDFGITYGSGAVQCHKATEKVAISNVAVATQGFGNCYEENNVLFPASRGILGLGFTANAQSGSTSFVEQAYRDGVISSPVFALSLGDFHSSGSSNELTLGGYDSSAFSGSLSWNVGLSTRQFAINMDGVFVNGNAVVTSSSEEMIAIIDSGSSLIIGPPAAVSMLYSQIKGASQVASGVWQFPCTSSASVSFVFGGVSYGLAASDMITGYVDSSKTMCLGAISSGAVAIESSSSVGWVLGDVFLKNVYAVFDMSANQVGLAKKSGSVAVSGSFTTVPVSQITQVAVGPYAGNVASKAPTVVTQQAFQVLQGTTIPNLRSPIAHATGIAKGQQVAAQVIPTASGSVQSISSGTTLQMSVTQDSGNVQATSVSSLLLADSGKTTLQRSASITSTTLSTATSTASSFAASTQAKSSAASQTSTVRAAAQTSVASMSVQSSSAGSLNFAFTLAVLPTFLFFLI